MGGLRGRHVLGGDNGLEIGRQLTRMGIPSYFAHLVRTHRRVIKEIRHTRDLQRLYLDCNSIIYDSVRTLEYDPKHGKRFEAQLIQAVVDRIKTYITDLKPKELAFVAFDGVAPVAKLEQQRGRRYKGSWHKRALAHLARAPPPSWDTTAITPGTKFMSALSRGVSGAFSRTVCRALGVQRVIVSPPSTPGEGEHKIYQHIRNTRRPGTGFSAVYGLDADLIMLTMNHLRFDPTLVLYRETPDFIRSLDRTLDPNKRYVLDMPLFARLLGAKLGTGSPSEHTIPDYILSCFLLGNDFLPHFPALNIRIDGLERVGDALQKLSGTKWKGLTRDRDINWPQLGKLIRLLADQEEDAVEGCLERRNKQARNVRRNLKTDDDWINALPMLDREEELYTWRTDDSFSVNRHRYYTELLGFQPTEERVRHICMTYLRGLAWTWQYYTGDCASWAWHYPFPYPPLLTDLVLYVPSSAAQDLVPRSPAPPVDPWVQLAYVLPAASLHLLPPTLREGLPAEWYPHNVQSKYAFCRYLWESHPMLPTVPLEKLGAMVTEASSQIRRRGETRKAHKGRD